MGVLPAASLARQVDEPMQINMDFIYGEAVEILGEEGLCAIAGALDMFRKK